MLQELLQELLQETGVFLQERRARDDGVNGQEVSKRGAGGKGQGAREESENQ